MSDIIFSKNYIYNNNEIINLDTLEIVKLPFIDNNSSKYFSFSGNLLISSKTYVNNGVMFKLIRVFSLQNGKLIGNIEFDYDKYDIVNNIMIDFDLKKKILNKKNGL